MRYIRRRLEVIKTKMEEVQFLMSNSYKLFLEKIVQGVTGRYDLKVIFTDGVFTDNKVVSVNPIHPYVMKIEGITGKTVVVLGQLAHEVFHIIYTSFSVLRKLQKEFESEGEFRLQQAHQCLNIIEDSAIELIGTNYYAGTFRTAIIANNKNAFENMPSLNKMEEDGNPRLAIFKQACAMYCILGKMKGELIDPELIDLFSKAIPILDKGRLEPKTQGRYEAAKELYNLMLPLIEEAEELRETEEVTEKYKYTKKSEMSKGRGAPSSGGAAKEVKITKDFTGKGREATKKDIEEALKRGMKPSSTDESKDSSEGTSGSRDTKEEETGGEDKGRASSSGTEEEKGDKEKDDKTKGSESTDSLEDPASDDKEAVETGDEDGEERDSDTSKAEDFDDSLEGLEDDLLEGDETDSESKDDGSPGKDGSEKSGEEHEEESDEDDTFDEDLEKYLKDLDEDLKDVYEDAAKEEYDKEEQRKADREIREFARTVKFSDVHRNIRVDARRNFDVRKEDEIKYSKTLSPYSGLCRSLIRRMRDIIRYNEDVKTTGLVSGRLNRNQLHRNDKMIFYKRQEKSDEADLIVTLLVDESGSMSGMRARYAREAAIFLYEVCNSLKIPISVIGYDAVTGGDVVNHRHYIDFESRDPLEKYKLLNITAYAQNRDGYSIRYAGKFMERRPETDKILIVITDGAPWHPAYSDSYTGEYGLRDTGRAVKDLEKRDITVFGLAIGDGKSDIKKIFTRNYIDIPDLKLLPSKLASLIERNILKE